MGVRAVLTVHDGEDYARFYGHWASPQYQIRHLADLVHHHDTNHLPLTLTALRAYLADRPGLLPDEDITADGWYADPDDAGDLDHRYRLDLRPAQRAFRYQVGDRNRDLGPTFTACRVLRSRAELYTAAADICTRQAGLPVRYPHEPDAGWWAHQADQYRQWLADADPARYPDDPPLDPATRRRTARLIHAVLREHWPAESVHVHTSADGAIRLDAPGWWAQRTTAYTIAVAVSPRLGRSQSIHVHTPADRRVRLTLRPHNPGPDQPRVTGALR